MNVVDSRHWEKLPPLFGTDIMVLVGGSYVLIFTLQILLYNSPLIYYALNAVISMAGTQNP